MKKVKNKPSIAGFLVFLLKSIPIFILCMLYLFSIQVLPLFLGFKYGIAGFIFGLFIFPVHMLSAFVIFEQVEFLK